VCDVEEAATRRRAGEIRRALAKVEGNARRRTATLVGEIANWSARANARSAVNQLQGKVVGDKARWGSWCFRHAQESAANVTTTMAMKRTSGRLERGRAVTKTTADPARGIAETVVGAPRSERREDVPITRGAWLFEPNANRSEHDDAEIIARGFFVS
jgi:hypothetical protein